MENCDDGLVTYAKDFAAHTEFPAGQPKALEYLTGWEQAATPFLIERGTWTATMDTPELCDEPTYSEPCDTVSPDPLCNGALPAMASIEPEPGSWWDWLLPFFVDEPELVIPTIVSGDVASDDFATVKVRMAQPGGSFSHCTGAATGANTVATAAHCIDNNVPNLDRVYVTSSDDAHATKYYVHRVQYHPNRDDTVSNDMALLHINPDQTLPTPYVPIYDPVADASNCTALIWQGYGSGTTNTECEYYVGWQEVNDYPTSSGNKYGYCLNPADAYITGGDSGGPLYAIVSGSPELIGSVSSGVVYAHHETYLNSTTKTWFDANNEDPGELMGSGVTLEAFWMDIDRSGAAPSTDDGDIVRTCKMEATATGDPIEYMGCSIENNITNKVLSCFDTTPVGDLYECSITIPRYSSAAVHDSWRVSRVYTRTTAGAEETADLSDATYLTDLHIANSSQQDGPPIIAQFVPSVAPVDPAPGGTATCIVQANDTVTGDEELKAVGCTYESVSYGSDLSCYVHNRRGSVPLFSGTLYYCDVQLPADVPEGSVWTLTKYHAQNTNNRSSTSTTGSGFTVFDCAEATWDSRYVYDTVDEWGTDQTETIVTGTHPEYEFYARASAVDQLGGVAISEDLIDGPEDIDLGIRFNSSGNIDVYDNGAWAADTTFPYVADTWYRFRLSGAPITYPGGSPSATYTVRVSKCGEEETVLRAGALANSGARMLAGPTHWNIFSWHTSQTVDVIGMTWNATSCFPTTCASEGWDCGTPPDGCGGDASGACDGGGCGGGEGCVNYVCQ
jgi:hypothetical protein